MEHSKKMHTVTFDGAIYGDIPHEYEEGQAVRLVYGLIPTDTDCSFSFWGLEERPEIIYTEDEGYIISFIMPSCDVKLEAVLKNSMVVEVPKPGLWDKIKELFRR